LGAAEAVFETLTGRMYDDERESYERTVEEARERLGDAHLAAVRAEGHELGTDAAVALALATVLAPVPVRSR
jgi:hypothetical protein